MVHTDSGTRIGISAETDRLRHAALWGPVGAEALLAQVLPTSVSLFHSAMDVLQAQQEAMNFTEVLRGFGVRVDLVRDGLARQLAPDTSLGVTDLLRALVCRAQELSQQYGRPLPIGFEEDLTQLVAFDVARYGEVTAVEVNKTLCLDGPLPLGNVLYSRDQLNVLFSTRVRASMRYPIRQREVDLYELFYADMFALAEPLVLPPGETFEGGDAYLHDGWVYLGAGDRTTLGAAAAICQRLAPELVETGFQFAVVHDPSPTQRSREQLMDFMHLDTFSCPVGAGQIVVCESEARHREILIPDFQPDGSIAFLSTGRTFLQHLQHQGQEVFLIPEREQREFGCNMLTLDGETLFVPLTRNVTILDRLAAAGKRLIPVELEACTKGYGAAHCMVAQLRREKENNRDRS